jgi:hypothetical protein
VIKFPFAAGSFLIQLISTETAGKERELAGLTYRLKTKPLRTSQHLTIAQQVFYIEYYYPPPEYYDA